MSHGSIEKVNRLKQGSLTITSFTKTHSVYEIALSAKLPIITFYIFLSISSLIYRVIITIKNKKGQATKMDDLATKIITIIYFLSRDHKKNVHFSNSPIPGFHSTSI